MRMAAEVLVERTADSVSAIVGRTKVLVDRLRCAILHQDNLTKDCFDTNATELSKTVDTLKRSFAKLSEEYQGVKEEVRAGEKRLTDILEELKEVAEKNARLKEVEKELLNLETLADENSKMAQELRELLHAYKLLTGVRFDYDDRESLLTGYVAISGNKPVNSTVIPFEVDTEKGGKGLLWAKINEACLEITD